MINDCNSRMVAPVLAKYNSGTACALDLMCWALCAGLRSETISHSDFGAGEEVCPNRSTANAAMGTAIGTKTGRNRPRRSGLPARRHSVPARCRCRERTPFRVAPNAAPCWANFPSPSASAGSADSNCTPASNARISTRRAGLNACSRCRRELRGKTRATNARSIRSACAWRSRLQPARLLAPMMPGAHSIIFSKTDPVQKGCRV